MVAMVIFAPFAGVYVVEGNYMAIGLYVAALVAMVAFFVLRENMWILIPCGVATGFEMRFLPIPFSLGELATLLALGYLILAFVVMERRKIQFGPPMILFPLIGLCALIGYHWWNAGFGLRVLGSGEYIGGRANFNFLIGIIPYFVILTSGQTVSRRIVSFLPFLIAASYFASSIPFLISTFYPSTTPIIFTLFGEGNLMAFRASTSVVGLEEGGGGRLGPIGWFGYALQLGLISYYPIQTWLRPGRWWVAGVSIIAFILVALSGYRGYIATFGMLTLFGAFLHLRWKSIWIWLAGGTIAIGMVLIQNAGFPLPYTVQRSIAFLPGDWDYNVIRSTHDSNNFRETIQEIYWNDFAWNSPWIGNGFAISMEDLAEKEKLENFGTTFEEMVRTFILTKSLHEGELSLWDAVGIVGIFFLLLMSLGIVREMYKNRDLIAPAKLTPLTTFAFVSLLVTYVRYFTVYGRLEVLVPQLCLFSAILLISFQRQREEEKIKEESRETQNIN